MVDGRAFAKFRIRTSSNEQIIALLNDWATDDAANDVELQACGKWFATWASRVGGSDADRQLACAKRIHKFVRDSVAFQREATETHRSGILTLSLGAGDCDDQSALVKALALTSGMFESATVHGLRATPDAEITHACSTIRVAGKDEWAETTVDAFFGEHPFEAARRLGLIDRSDVTG